MPDIIQLLPDSVANQIAAGEVIQRPASAVKELMENAIDSGASVIKLIIKDGGKSLIQVIDNGCGMSETDARLSFERHATSKIKTANDLFAIKTKGFRGEALASIAAIAHVTLKTKKIEDELGTQIVIEGSTLVTQEACAAANGSSFAIKNLFYNVPARRNFLKKDSIELKHIYDEFQRVAFAHPTISFELHSNENQVYKLEEGNFRQRIVGLLGNKYNQRLVPITEDTDIVKITGYIGKPEFALKSRGEQFLFVNNRFIKSNYLHHAIQNAFQDLIGKDQHPSYFLLLDVPTDKIDVNIHPTKTEVKFIEEKAIYAILRSATKKALGEHNIAPTLDFSLEQGFEISVKPTRQIQEPTIAVNPEYNPFNTENSITKQSIYTKPITANKELTDANNQNWESLYKGISDVSFDDEEDGQQLISSDWKSSEIKTDNQTTYQIHQKYIITQVKSGLLIIDQQKAHERVLYERFLKSLVNNKEISQQQLFPITIEFSASDFELVKDLEHEIRTLGFDIREFGKNTFVVNGTPSDISKLNIKEVLEGLIEQFVKNTSELKLEKRDSLARSLAYNMALKSGKKLDIIEMNALIDQLFNCENPYASPNGKPTIITFTLDDLFKQFNR